MPESNYAVGCAGNLLVIPEKSHHKDLSAKFIDYVLSDDVQNFLGNAGGIPVAADTSKITDAKSKAMIEEYDSYAKDGKHQEAGRRAQEHPREVRHRRRGYGRQEQLKTTDPSFPFQLQ